VSDRTTTVRRHQQPLLPALARRRDVLTTQQLTYGDDKLTFDVRTYRARRQVLQHLLYTLQSVNAVVFLHCSFRVVIIYVLDML